FGLPPQEAVDAPRFHEQWLPDTVFMEPRAFSPDTQAALRGMGYTLSTQSPWGAVEMIAVGDAFAAAAPPSSGNDAAVGMGLLPGRLYGASDPRRPAGAAVGE
ncbi:MAG TPA: gamma-glutamyltransferase, partial [Acetobacteraceae bacterium]|nr:gamma-glutamyltransferase [Acetobacteraceae bacterium]